MNRRQFVSGIACALGSSAQGFGRAADVQRSPITNRWGDAKTTKLDLEEVCVFRGRPGAAYNHHHQIAMHQGRLYASWSNGIVGEDNPGQRMMFATSDDDGKTWSAEVEISPPRKDETSTYTAMGIRPYQNKLVAYYGHYGWTRLAFDETGKRIWANYRNDPAKWLHHDTFTEVRVSEDRGQTWSAPLRIIDRFCPNLRPFPIRSGRLIITGNITFPYTDDPAGIRHWKTVGLPRLPKWEVDDPEGFVKAGGYRGDLQDYCEASFFQTDDNRLHMMLRTIALQGEKHNGLLAVTESKDQGKSWSEPMMTSYTDCCCRFQFGRLPDGRFFGLSCPDPHGPRSPMVLALSRDGVVFDRHYILGDKRHLRPRLAGNDKGGDVYGYPSCDIADGKMYVVSSRCKEDIYFVKLDLAWLT